MTTSIDYQATASHAAGRRWFASIARKAMSEFDMVDVDLAREILGKTPADYKDEREYWIALDAKVDSIAEVLAGQAWTPGLMRKIAEVLGLEADEVAA